MEHSLIELAVVDSQIAALSFPLPPDPLERFISISFLRRRPNKHKLFLHYSTEREILEFNLASPQEKIAGDNLDPISYRFIHAKSHYHITCCASALHLSPLLPIVAATVWEGIIQGASYDLFKTYVRNSFGGLRAVEIFPSGAHRNHQTISKTELSFQWNSRNIYGNRHRNISINFKREYRIMNENNQTKRAKTLRASSRKSDTVK